jgi:uncharacterized RDD family membrane protein YckC
MEEDVNATTGLNAPEVEVVHYAGTGNRLLNALIDLPLCFMGGAAVSILLARLPGLEWLHPGRLLADQGGYRSQVVLICYTLPYYFFFEYFLGKTPGKFITRTRVIRIEDGERPLAWQILLRTVLRNFPMEFLWYVFSSVGPHDFLSRTLVVEDEVSASAD